MMIFRIKSTEYSFLFYLIDGAYNSNYFILYYITQPNGKIRLRVFVIQPSEEDFHSIFWGQYIIVEN